MTCGIVPLIPGVPGAPAAPPAGLELRTPSGAGHAGGPAALQEHSGATVPHAADYTDIPLHEVEQFIRQIAGASEVNLAEYFRR